MSAPRYRQIADELRRRILTGDLPAGAKLPSENQLAVEFNVAPETARRALGTLAAEGLTEAKRGSGTRVRPFRPIHRQATKRLAQSQWGEGKAIWQADVAERPRSEDRLVVEERACPEHIAPALNLEAGAVVLVRERRYLVEDEPVMLATSYLPAALVAGSPIAEANTGPGGTYARLADLGHGPVWFKEQVRFRAAFPEEAEALQLGPGASVALIVRYAFADGGVPVEVNEMTLDASRYVLEWEFPA